MVRIQKKKKTSHELSEKETGYYSDQPLYVQIKGRIQDIIKTRNLSSGHRLPSVRELSSLIGTSRATAARAVARMINEGVFVSRPREGVYLCNPSETPVRQELQTIYCLLSSSRNPLGAEGFLLNNPFWSQVLAGIRQAVMNVDQEIRLRFLFMVDFLKESNVTPRGRSWEGVGFIVLGDSNPGLLPQLGHLGAPIVQIHGINSTRKIPSVRIDCAAGAEMLMDHLVSLGHRRIGYCGPRNAADDAVNYERYKGYLRGVRKHKLPVDESVYCSHCGAGMAEGNQGIRKLLHLDERPTAVLCLNDEVAMGAMRAISDAGLAIPRDISITGFDNIAAGSYLVPSLTTVSSRMVELGQMGVSRLFAVHERDEQNDYIFKPELIVRESSGSVKPR